MPNTKTISNIPKTDGLKRPVVLSLKQLEKYPTRREVLAMTIPFKEQDVWPSHMRKVLKQTKKRWAWFSKARERDDQLNTRLGTLNYLPYEIRQQIYLEHLDSHFCSCPSCSAAGRVDRDWYWEYIGREVWAIRARNSWPEGERNTAPYPGVFEIEAYDVLCQVAVEPGSCTGGQWSRLPKASRAFSLSSPTVKAEWQYFFLSNRRFQFICPYSLQQFLDQLSPAHQSLLQHIAIDFLIDECCSLSDSWNGWMGICSVLPSTLKSVTFRLTRYGLRQVQPDFHEQRCFVKQLRILKRLAILTETIHNKLARRIPGIKVSWRGYTHPHEYLKREEWAILQAAIEDTSNLSSFTIHD